MKNSSKARKRLPADYQRTEGPHRVKTKYRRQDDRAFLEFDDLPDTHKRSDKSERHSFEHGLQ